MNRLWPILLFLSVFVPSAQADDSTAALRKLVSESRTAWASVRDYRSEFVKQELAGGTLGPRERIFLKFEKPFKIFMQWLDTEKKGLQVLYERGRHGGKLAIHKPGLLLGLAPVVFLDPDSPWVREGSESYDIEDAGIGTFLEDFSKMVEKAASEGKLDVSMSETADGTYADVSFPGSAPDEVYFASRTEVLFDAASRLPVRMTLYDWQGTVTGIYEYNELRLNLGAEDDEFRRLAHKKLQRLYLPPLKTAKKTNFSPR